MNAAGDMDTMEAVLSGFIDELHRRHGRCIACGKRGCPDPVGSRLPETLPTHDVPFVGKYVKPSGRVFER